MRRMENWGVGLFFIGLLLGLTIHAGFKYGFYAALLYFGVFGVIIGFLLFVTFLFSEGPKKKRR